MKPIKLEDYATRYEYVTMERREGILQVSIHEKNDRNTPVRWGVEPHQELSYVFYDIARDHENHCVIITGVADTFIGAETTLGDRPIPPSTWDHAYQDCKFLLMNHLSFEVPTIAAVNGPALIRAELALLCDIVLASDTAEFQDAPHFPRGVVPGDGVHLVWPLLLGPNRGRYFLLTGQTLSAQEAMTLGVVNEVMLRDRLLPRAWELARQITARPTLAARYARVAMTQTLKQMMLADLGYGFALEGLSAAHSWGMPKK